MLRLRRVDTAVQTPTDEALMLAYAGGDGDAFTELYERHRARLFHYLLGQLRDRPLAEELFQDIWQRVVHARAGWKPEAAFATWLVRIAHNRLNDHWRAARHRPAVPDDALLAAMVAAPILINRPFVFTPKGVRLCRPPERVLDLL